VNIDFQYFKNISNYIIEDRGRRGRDRMVRDMCNQSLSPLKLWVRIPFIARCTRYNIMWCSLPVTCDRSVVFSGYSGFSHQ